MSGLAPILIPVLVTICTAVILAVLRYATNRIKENMEAQQQLKEERDAQRAKDQYDILTRIENQTTLTNGRVTETERRIGIILERLSHVEGEHNILMQVINKTAAP